MACEGCGVRDKVFIMNVEYMFGERYRLLLSRAN